MIDQSDDGHITPQPPTWRRTLAGIYLERPPKVSRRLLLVQASDQQTWDELQNLGVKGDFINSHKHKRRWYMSEDPDSDSERRHMPELPSQTGKLDFITWRFITAGRYPGGRLPDGVSVAHVNGAETCGRNCLDHVPGPGAPAALVVQPLTPVTQKKPNPPVMYAHTYVSAWFKVDDNGKGWTGEHAGELYRLL